MLFSVNTILVLVWLLYICYIIELLKQLFKFKMVCFGHEWGPPIATVLV